MVIIDFQEAEWPKKVEIFTRLINHILRDSMKKIFYIIS